MWRLQNNSWIFLWVVLHSMILGSVSQNTGEDFNPSFLRNVGLESSCATVQDCKNCTNTYSCHWCEKDQSCHAKGSPYGCSWGSSCSKPPPPQPSKENSTCAAHKTCSDCSLSSHLCHWCEHDNACHAIGSRYGCTVGVDCYSNDRCRRQEPEKFKRFVISEIPMTALTIVLLIGSAIIACISCCYCFWGGVKGAYDDLATISMAASTPPSMIGGTIMGPGDQFYSTLETHPEGDEEVEGAAVDQANDAETGETNEQGSTQENAGSAPSMEQQQMSQPEVELSPYTSMDDTGGQGNLSAPLLHPSARSFNGASVMAEPTHANYLYRMCSICYYISILLVIALVGVVIFFFPKQPVYNVCNDAVAWQKIIENIIAFKLDASFEILVSVSNPNHLSVILDEGKGSFTFDGKPVGTYEIPGETAAAMAITDLMLVAHVTPDKYQAAQMAEAYFRGKLVLEADFNAKLRVPALMNLNYNLQMTDIAVYVNELSDRSLCYCPSWDEQKNKTESLQFLFGGYN